MGKTGSWFSAIKKVFRHNSKEKPSDGPDKKSSKEKKNGRGLLRHGETKSFIPLFREPSSIEKILREADQLRIRPPFSSELTKTPPVLPWRPPSPSAASPKASFLKAASPRAFRPSTSNYDIAYSSKANKKVNQSHKEIGYWQRQEPTLRNQHISANKIQSAYRGYLARRSFRALRGLVRLQGVVRGKNVKRQTINAMKQMQLFVRAQTQIQSRRIQMLENQAIQRQLLSNIEKEVESTLSNWTLTQLPEGIRNDDWDDSLLTKEEEEARLLQKVEAVIKRDRAMTYAYSHQLRKSNPKSAHGSPLEIRSNRFPWWWSWLERQLPPHTPSHEQAAVARNAVLTPPRPISDNHRSSTLGIMARTKKFQTLTPPNNDYSKSLPLRDDNDSLTSCPPFSVPSYMSPTVSAKAKSRANSNPKERHIVGTARGDDLPKRRFSFSLTPNNIIGSLKLGKGGDKDYASRQEVMEKRRYSSSSIGDLSVDSAVSMPAIGGGRKPFNRFV